MFCSNCGNKTDDGDRFCTGCGAGLPASKRTVLSSENKKLLFVFAGALAVLLIAFLVLSPTGGGGQSTPKAAAESFFKAMQRGNAREMIKTFDPVAIKDMEAHGYGRDLAVMQMEMFLQQIDLIRYQVVDVMVWGDTATAYVYTQVKHLLYGYEESEEDTLEIDLVLRDGKWYVGEDFFWYW